MLRTSDASRMRPSRVSCASSPVASIASCEVGESAGRMMRSKTACSSSLSFWNSTSHSVHAPRSSASAPLRRASDQQLVHDGGARAVSAGAANTGHRRGHNSTWAEASREGRAARGTPRGGSIDGRIFGDPPTCVFPGCGGECGALDERQRVEEASNLPRLPVRRAVHHGAPVKVGADVGVDSRIQQQLDHGKRARSAACRRLNSRSPSSDFCIPRSIWQHSRARDRASGEPAGGRDSAGAPGLAKALSPNSTAVLSASPSLTLPAVGQPASTRARAQTSCAPAQAAARHSQLGTHFERRPAFDRCWASS
eukprot:2780874-Prymnesium_polylepis.2